jgi:integrase
MPSIKMTNLWLARLKNTKSGRIEYFDNFQSGLGLRVGKTKMSWMVLYRVAGSRKLKRMTLGKYPSMKLVDARDKAKNAVYDADNGIDPAYEKLKEREAPTFDELADEYLVKHGSKKRSFYEDNRIIDKDFRPVWKGRKAHDIKRKDVIRLLDEIVDRGAPIQANRTLALIRKMYNWAIGRDLVEANPCTQINAPGTEKQRDRVLSEIEIKALWEAFEAEGKAIEPMFKLRLITAQRGGEIESMRPQDIDLESGWWTIPAQYSKNNLSHRVPLSNMAIDILLAHKKAMDDVLEKAKHKAHKSGKAEDKINCERKKEKYSKWLFPSPVYKNDLPISNVQKAAQRVNEHSGVADFKLHDLRRTAASYMTSIGIPRLVVSKILNHVEQGVTRVYDRHSYDKEKRAALDKWSRRLQSILTGEKAKVVKLNIETAKK